MDKSIRVYGQGKYTAQWEVARQIWVSSNGDRFEGTRNEAREYYRDKYPHLSIIISVEPKK